MTSAMSAYAYVVVLKNGSFTKKTVWPSTMVWPVRSLQKAVRENGDGRGGSRGDSGGNSKGEAGVSPG